MRSRWLRSAVQVGSLTSHWTSRNLRTQSGPRLINSALHYKAEGSDTGAQCLSESTEKERLRTPQQGVRSRNIPLFPSRIYRRGGKLYFLDANISGSREIIPDHSRQTTNSTMRLFDTAGRSKGCDITAAPFSLTSLFSGSAAAEWVARMVANYWTRQTSQMQDMMPWPTR